jgi:hypothetical protein
MGVRAKPLPCPRANIVAEPGVTSSFVSDVNRLM